VHKFPLSFATGDNLLARGFGLPARIESLGTMMRLPTIVAALALFGTVATANDAVRPAPSPEDSRFTLHATDDGYLRLDGRTGQVAACARRAGDWTCQAVDERATPERAARLDEPRLRPPRGSTLQRMMMAVEMVWQRVVVLVADARNGLMGKT
jgi:hypothetical protein